MIRKFFNRVIGFFLFLFLFTPAVEAIPVKVITYNIANTIAVPIHKKRSRALIVELEKMFLEANEKNEFFVLFLQETFSLKFIEDLKKLSEAHNVYMTHTYQTDSKTYKHGLAILTNLTNSPQTDEPSTFQEKFTPWNEDAFNNTYRRGMLTLCLKMNSNHQPLCFVDLHMTYTYQPLHGVSKMHQSQLNQLKDYLKTIPYPTVVAGDFNLGNLKWWVKKTLWTDPEIDKYWENYKNDFNKIGFQHFSSPEEQISFSRKNALVKKPAMLIRTMNIFGVETPYYGQIDHIFYKNGLECSSLEFCCMGEMCFKNTSYPFELSDHYGITASFDLKTPDMLALKFSNPE